MAAVAVVDIRAALEAHPVVAGAVQMIGSFIKASKAEVVAQGTKIGVPFELTWSCYEGGDKACGVCATCRDRLQAFAENGLIDPVPYEG